MALDFQQALDQYGFVGVLVKNNPELKGLFNRAVTEEWNSARFERELANTPWWKRLNERKRQVAVMQATDPATWNTTFGNKKNEIHALANRMGITLTSGAQIDSWAKAAIENDWDENALRTFLMDRGKPTFAKANGGYVNEAGQIESQVRSTYSAYGIPLSQGRVDQIVKGVIGGRATIDGLVNEARSAAKKQYAQFAQEIDAGLTIADIADPYRQTMANTLELPDTEITLNDPAIKRALMNVGPDGKAATKPLYQFERELKEDPRWQRTKQAHNEYSTVLQQVGKDWGFA